MAISFKILESELQKLAPKAAERRSQVLDTIRALPAEAGRRELAALAVALLKLAVNEGAVGTAAVLSGHESGWRTVVSSALSDEFRIKTLMALQRLNGRQLVEPRDLSLVYLQAVALGEPSPAHWAGDLLRLVENDPDRYALADFALHVAILRRDLPAGSSPLPASGVYHDLLVSWPHENHCARALEAAANYHIAQTFDPNDDQLWVEFEHHPYTLFPVELVAFLRTRAAAGLPSPRLDHPLLASPLANPPNATRFPNGSDFLRSIGLPDPLAEVLLGVR